jgi:hypothetical protein
MSCLVTDFLKNKNYRERVTNIYVQINIQINLNVSISILMYSK